ncbi:hypothetical protein BDC45DRAFT_82956 [Circinella umbellata]|nr:hypothetical protein BDC45DRAFT_82956 [Circinella umbellata]
MMNDRQRASLFMCLVARQLSGNSQISDQEEILSITQKLAHDENNSNGDGIISSSSTTTTEAIDLLQKQESFNGVLQIFQVEALISLKRFDKVIQSIENCCKVASNLSHLYLCERLVESVLQSQHSSKQDGLKVLQKIILLYQKQYSEQRQQWNNNNNGVVKKAFIERYSKWIRLLVSTALAVSKETGFQCLEETYNYLKQHGVSMNYPESELYYLVVVAWNEGITWFHANDNNHGSAWCKLAFDLLSLYNDTNQKESLKQKLTQAYANLCIKKVMS